MWWMGFNSRQELLRPILVDMIFLGPFTEGAGNYSFFILWGESISGKSFVRTATGFYGCGAKFCCQDMCAYIVHWPFATFFEASL